MNGIMSLMFLQAILIGFESEGDSSAIERSGFVCGPRCVSELLKHYGRPENLVELVREIQWPDLEAGANVDAIQQSLQKRGIRALVVRIPKDGILRWPHPVIVHVERPPNPAGHYLVCKHSRKDNRLNVSDPSPASTSSLVRGFWANRSGVVVVTSPQAFSIEEVSQAVSLAPNRAYGPTSILGGLLGLQSLILIFSLWPHRR